MFSLIFTNDSPSGKLVTVASPEGNADVPADFLRQGPVGVAGKDFQPRFAHKVAAILPRRGDSGRLFCAGRPGPPGEPDELQLLLQRVHPVEELRQALLEHGDAPLEDVGDGRGAVDIAAGGHVGGDAAPGRRP